MENKEIHYHKICEGVWLSRLIADLPHNILIEGKQCELFLDHFYLDRPLDKLSTEQVIEICRLREEISECRAKGSPNSIVRNVFSEMIRLTQPKSVLEIGPGMFPLFSSNTKEFDYMLGELDYRVVESNKTAGYNIHHFDIDSSLSIPDGYIDIIFGIFVFQFNISDKQIKELERVLNINGGLMINVYHRNDNERDSLIRKLELYGLLVQIVEDPIKLCRQHQYWMVSKSAPAELHDTYKSVINSSNLL